jgi:hypothetical protein
MPPKKKITPSQKSFHPIPIDVLKQELKTSYENKRNEMITFFTKVTENTSKEKSTPDEEENHLQIIYQNGQFENQTTLTEIRERLKLA